MAMVVRVSLVALLAACAPLVAQPPRAALPTEETRAVAFLAREVPRWKTENDCYSCHNNGDAARALIVATARGHAVGDALDDTLAWLRQPQKWNHNSGVPRRSVACGGASTTSRSRACSLPERCDWR